MKFPKSITNVAGKTTWLRKNLGAVRMLGVLKAKLADKDHLHSTCSWQQAVLKVISKALWSGSSVLLLRPRSLFVWSARALAGQLESLGLNEPSECGAGEYQKGNASIDTDLPLMAYSCKSVFLEEDRSLQNKTKKTSRTCQLFFFF